jgi:hypothetical protein
VGEEGRVSGGDIGEGRRRELFGYVNLFEKLDCYLRL